MYNAPRAATVTVGALSATNHALSPICHCSVFTMVVWCGAFINPPHMGFLAHVLLMCCLGCLPFQLPPSLLPCLLLALSCSISSWPRLTARF